MILACAVAERARSVENAGMTSPDGRRRPGLQWLLPLLLLGCAPRHPPADAVFFAARIYTLAGDAIPDSAGAEPWVAGLAVRAGRIVAAGDRRALGRWIGSATRVADWPDATIFPGFVDCHIHMAGLGRSLREVRLFGTASYDEVVARAAERARTLPAGQWVAGRGWDQNDWPDTRFPDHAALSAATPDHPVYLRRIDGHAVLVNARALAIAGVDARTRDPAGGRIVRRPDGSPSGVLVDAAVDLVAAHVPKPDAAERRARLETAFAHCAAAGLTGVHDAGIGPLDLADYRELLAERKLPLRVYVMLGGAPDTEDRAALAAAVPQPFDSTAHLAVRAIKLVADGALGSRGAALLAPYSDAPGERGLPQYDLESFLALARPLHARGFQIATHCIGDAANRMVLDAYAHLEDEVSRPDARHRIEHAQILAPEDIPRFAAQHVLPSMQPTHCTSDMPWAEARIGAARLPGAYAWRTLREAGSILPAGSDAPVESVSPLLGIYAAVTREDQEGRPAGGWLPEQRLTRSEALRGFTTWAAVASFTEAEIGRLVPGMRADFVVLDRDLLRVAPHDIAGATVRATCVGGDLVFGAAPPAR